jgi:hypothetical protein
MRHFFSGSLALAVICALFSLPTAASAHPQEHWAPGTTVCVSVPISDRIARNWDVRHQVERWIGLSGGPRFIFREFCPYKNSIRIRAHNASGGYQAITYPEYNWATGELSHVEIKLNPEGVREYQAKYPSFSRGKLWCLRAWAMSHETGHAFGEPHYPTSYGGNTMSYQDWWYRCGGLGPKDLSVYYQIY